MGAALGVGLLLGGGQLVLVGVVGGNGALVVDDGLGSGHDDAGGSRGDAG